MQRTGAAGNFSDVRRGSGASPTSDRLFVRCSVAIIEPNGRPHIECRRCRVTVVWPSSLTAAQTTEVAAVTRKDRLEGIRYAKAHLGLGPREAKALALHITKIPGVCHRCGKAVPKGESACVCRSANLDW